MTAGSRTWALALAAIGASFLWASEASATPGAVAQKPGPEGCVSENGLDGQCSDNSAVGTRDAIVSGDGQTLYAAGAYGISIFNRDDSGALAQDPAQEGCISTLDFFVGWCAPARKAGLNANDLALPADEDHLYVAGSDYVAAFSRDASTGGLEQLPGISGCTSVGGAEDGCAQGRALNEVAELSISPDGANAYAAAEGSDALSVFDRNEATGTLTQKPGPLGCFMNGEPQEGCAEGQGLKEANAVVVSPDGHNVYVGSDGGPSQDTIAVYDRDLATGELSQAGSLSACAAGIHGGTFCDGGDLVRRIESLVVSPDGLTVYAVSRNGGYQDALLILDRDPSSGDLTQRPGAQGCIASLPGKTPCRDMTGALPVEAALSPDGENLYVAFHAGGIATFDRDPLTGDVQQKSSPESGCAPCSWLHYIQGLAISPDGTSIYTPSSQTDSIAVLRREVTTFIDQGPVVRTSSDAPTFLFSSDLVGGGFECRYDSAAFAACSGADSHTEALDDGSHTFEVRSVAPGYVDATPAIRTFVVDTEPPDTTIQSGPFDCGKNCIAFDVSGTEALSAIDCRIGDVLHVITSNSLCRFRHSEVPDGPNTFEATAIDQAGNEDPTPAEADFDFLGNPPEVGFTDLPAGVVKTKTKFAAFSFSFSSPDDVAFECRVGDLPREICESPFDAVVPVPKGRSTVRIRVFVTDTQGRTSDEHQTVFVRRARR